MSYIIIDYDKDYMEVFASMVDEYVKQGYTPAGGPFFNDGKICQALYKTKEEQKEEDSDKED